MSKSIADSSFKLLLQHNESLIFINRFSKNISKLGIPYFIWWSDLIKSLICKHQLIVMKYSLNEIGLLYEYLLFYCPLYI